MREGIREGERKEKGEGEERGAGLYLVSLIILDKAILDKAFPQGDDVRTQRDVCL